MAQRAHRVVVLAYDRLSTFELGLAVEVFGLRRPELGIPWYDFAVAAFEAGPLRATGGLRIEVDGGLDLLRKAETIIAPGWRDPEETPPAAILEALRKAHKRGTRLVSICSGVFLLAATGLLDGRAATTHWRYASALARRHPKVRVAPDVLYVDEGQILTSAGSAAGLDLCLHIVRKDHGAAVANEVARRLVLPVHREGGQAQFIAAPVAGEGEGRLAAMLDWMQRHCHEPQVVSALAARAGMSPRSFARRFKQATGLAPHDWLLRQRVRRAQDLLETGDLPIERIGERCGFGAPETLRHHFRRVLGTTPTAYRKAFGVGSGLGSEERAADQHQA